MLFALICRDKPGHLQLRQDNRAAHLDYIKATGVVVLAGPFIEEGAMSGSLIVLEADSLDAAKAWAARDPYALAGLFREVTVTEWRRVIG